MVPLLPKNQICSLKKLADRIPDPVNATISRAKHIVVTSANMAKKSCARCGTGSEAGNDRVAISSILRTFFSSAGRIGTGSHHFVEIALDCFGAFRHALFDIRFN